MVDVTFIELARILISFAILAPSGHNSQPWNFEITDNQIVIVPDMDKRLAVVDGDNRELFISLGCALANIQVAAGHLGYNSEYVYQDGKIVVSFSQQDGCADNELFAAIEKRHTHRGEFTGKKIPDELLKSFDIQPNTNILFFDEASQEASVIKRKIEEGNVVQMSDTAFKRELVSWMRFNKKHIEETHNGLCYNVLGFPSTPKPIGKRIVGMFLNPKAQNKTDNAINATVSHFCVLTVKENTEQNWIELGVTLERFLLKITSLGLAYSFSNQPCEISSLASQLKEELNISDFPSVVLRLGYGGEPKARSPREQKF